MPELKTESVMALPLDRAWKVTKKSDEILPIILPQFFSKVEILEGDGGAGTIRLITLGSAVPGPAGQTVKERIDIFDDATHTMVYSSVEGGDPRYKNMKFTLTFAARADSNSTAVSWTADYTPVDDSVPPPEDLKAFSQTGMKAIERYAVEHPEFAA